MTHFLLLIALCSPQVDGGVRFGGGLIEEAPMVLFQPWIGLQWDALNVAMGPPVRMDLEEGEIRSKDWDEVADYGRLIHHFSWKDSIRGGVVSHRSLANGTLIRRYHNGIDIDHARLGLDLRFADISVPSWSPNHYELLVDQILDVPVMGVAFGYSNIAGHLLLNGAADFAYPDSVDGTLNDEGWPRGSRSIRGGFGLSGKYRIWAPSSRYTFWILGDVDGLTTSAWGTHLGTQFEFKDLRRWRVELSSNLMLLGEGYTWSLFDTGYLIDRWRGIQAELHDAEQSIGSRSSLQVTYAESVIIGAHYADTEQSGRADLGSWLRVPLKRATIGAYWRVRRVDPGSAFFDLDEVMAAFSARAVLTQPLSVEFTLSRDWFAQPNGEYTPHTSVFLSVEASWSN